MRAIIRPGIARGVAEAPPSKSMAHRLLICAGLANGTSEIRRVDRSEDLLATADCLEALGAEVVWDGDAVRVRGCDPRASRSARLPCRESGSTLRFFIPLCLLSGNPMRLTGSEALLSRPLSAYRTLCAERGLRLETDAQGVWLEGPLRPGEFTLPGDVSSQFASGLLFALPLLAGDSAIRLIPPVESRAYIDMTRKALRDSGVAARWLDTHTLLIPGRSSYAPRDDTVEGDWSNAAFLEALNALGGSVRVTGLKQDSLQGDKVYPTYFARLAQGHPTLNVADCPDLAPVLLAVAAAKHGCTLTGTRRLRYKESDRGVVMAGELAKAGAKVIVEENEITVARAALHTPTAALSSHNDHRVAMALSVLCTHTGGEIEGAEAVRKSFPDYWKRLRALGIDVELADTDP